MFVPLYASGTPEGKPADSHPPPVISEKPAEKTEPAIKAESVTKVEPVIEAAPEAKPTVTEPEIVPYKSNPVAVKAVEKSTVLFAERIRERFA
ncbi:MAG: hypothetical protein Q8K51_05240, partial [Nitrospirota bacterium]|nr:hypothetical protein [Nitrospirota bacterium]